MKELAAQYALEDLDPITLNSDQAEHLLEDFMVRTLPKLRRGNLIWSVAAKECLPLLKVAESNYSLRYLEGANHLFEVGSLECYLESEVSRQFLRSYALVLQKFLGSEDWNL